MSFPVINISVLWWWSYVWTVTTTSAWGVWYRISNIGYPPGVWRRMISIMTSLPCDRWCSNCHLLSSENYCSFIQRIIINSWKKRSCHFSFISHLLSVFVLFYIYILKVKVVNIICTLLDFFYKDICKVYKYLYLRLLLKIFVRLFCEQKLAYSA